MVAWLRLVFFYTVKVIVNVGSSSRGVLLEELDHLIPERTFIFDCTNDVASIADEMSAIILTELGEQNMNHYESMTLRYSVRRY